MLKIIHRVKSYWERKVEVKEERLIDEIYRSQDTFNSYKRIYHFHIRKTGGTTINFAFLSHCCRDTAELYKNLAQRKIHRQIGNGKIVVAWDPALIQGGKYFYGFSHIPSHQLQLPEGTFTFTCLRDPVKRVLSHYNMLRYFQIEGIQHPCRIREEPWLGNSFGDFLNNIPNEYLLNQLYMFSKNFMILEAVENLRRCNFVLLTENLDSDLRELGRRLNLTLSISREKQYGYREKIEEGLLASLRKKLQPEYTMLAALANPSQRLCG